MAYAESRNVHPIEYHELIISLRDDLKAANKLSRVEYVGSAYKGTRVDQSDYDNLFVVRDSSIVAVPSGTYPDQYAELRRGGGYGTPVDPLETRRAFKSDLQKAINRLNLADKAKIHENGPAFAVHYYPNGWQRSSSVLFTADVDLCYEAPNVNGKYGMYVTKPPKGNPTYWKVTTDVQEKAKISIIDDGNCIGRWAVRILKAVKNAEPNLGVFKSCAFEHVLYYLKDRYPDKSLWRENNMAWVLRQMLEYLAAAVRAGSLKHYFLKSENLLPSMNAASKENVLNRLDRLARNPEGLLGRF